MMAFVDGQQKGKAVLATKRKANVVKIGVESVLRVIKTSENGDERIVQSFLVVPPEDLKKHLEFRTKVRKYVDVCINKNFLIPPKGIFGECKYEKTETYGPTVFSFFYVPTKQNISNLMSSGKGVHKFTFEIKVPTEIVMDKKDIGKCRFCDAYKQLPGGKSKCFLGMRLVSCKNPKKDCEMWEEK